MPELPEVETIRCGLDRVMLGAKVSRLEILDERLVRPRSIAAVAPSFDRVAVSAVRRRGKYLLIDLSSGVTAAHHLRMTGSFAWYERGSIVTHRHVRAWYVLSSGDRVAYNDPRRFGTLVVGARDDIEAGLDARLGPEPLDESAFTVDSLRRALRLRTCTIKAALLDQKIVAGLGNIYVDETLHLAGIRPTTRAGKVRADQCERLVPIIRERLLEAIEHGGSTLRDYRGVAGEVGGMQERFHAYGRTGLPCLACGITMTGGRVAGRGTTWCPACQR